MEVLHSLRVRVGLAYGLYMVCVVVYLLRTSEQRVPKEARDLRELFCSGWGQCDDSARDRSASVSAILAGGCLPRPPPQEVLVEKEVEEEQEDVPKKQEDQQPQENDPAAADKRAETSRSPARLIYQALVCLLIASALVSVAEVLRERCKHWWKGTEGFKEVCSGEERGRRISLAELTVSRHMRRESQQQLMLMSPAVDRPSRPVRIGHPPLLRRCSFPVQLPPKVTGSPRGVRGRTPPPRQQSWSADSSRNLSEEDSPPTIRRRVRFIHRH